MDGLRKRSITYRIVTGRDAGRKVATLQTHSARCRWAARRCRQGRRLLAACRRGRRGTRKPQAGNAMPLHHMHGAQRERARISALQASSSRTASASRVTICRLCSRRRNRNLRRCGYDPQGGARPPSAPAQSTNPLHRPVTRQDLDRSVGQRCRNRPRHHTPSATRRLLGRTHPGGNDEVTP